MSASNGAAHILVVDDHPENLKALETVLAPLGHDVVTANSGEEALMHLLQEDFAAVLMDVRMPTMDGFETVELMKRRKRNEDTAVIFLTGVEKEARQVFRGYSAGAVDYIAKPVDPDVLRSKVGVLVDLHQKTAALKESEERFRTAFSNAPIGIALISPEGEWLQANDALCQMLGSSPAELFRRPIYELTRETDRQAEREEFQRLIAEKPAFHQTEKRLVSSDGRQVRALVSVSLALDPQGRPLNFIWQLVDVTELERRAAELARSNSELEQFAYVASHDLQEPLRTIGGFAQLLERRYKGELDEDADRFIGYVVAGVDRMQTLIDDLLSYSRAGRRELLREEVDCCKLVEETVASLGAMVRETKGEVTLEKLPTLVVDRGALGQVFQNLLANALKFRDADPPKVQVSAKRADGAWTFTVEDNGIGIDPEQSERIFRMFQRLHAREDYSGTGIGLAICKRIVERHGGRIWCEPRSPRGTTFRFTIPDPEPAAS